MEYKPMEHKDIEFLTSVCGRDRRLVVQDSHETYSRDELVRTNKYPEVVCEVLSTEEVAKIMKYTSDNHIPVTPRGQGTG